MVEVIKSEIRGTFPHVLGAEIRLQNPGRLSHRSLSRHWMKERHSGQQVLAGAGRLPHLGDEGVRRVLGKRDVSVVVLGVHLNGHAQLPQIRAAGRLLPSGPNRLKDGKQYPRQNR